MSIKKYNKQIVIIVISLMTIVVLLVTNIRGKEDIDKLVVLNVIPSFLNLVASIGYICGLIIVGALLGIVFGYVFGPLYLYIHKLLIGRKKMIYGIQDKAQPDKFSDTFRGFFPALMAISLALMLSFIPAVQEILYPQIDVRFMTHFFSFLALLPLMTGVSIALFSPTWFLQDSRIIYSNSKKVEDKMRPVEVRSVGSYFIYLLNGYAGISVIFNFYLFTIKIMDFTDGNPVIALFIIPLPIIITILILLPVVVLDANQKHVRKFMLNFARKIGIIDILDLRVEKINN